MRAPAARRSGVGLTIPLDGVDAPADGRTADLLALDTALDKLAARDPRQARLVELRYFGGLTVDEAAAVLDVAAITVKRDWAMARTWLYRELGGTYDCDAGLDAGQAALSRRPGTPARRPNGLRQGAGRQPRSVRRSHVSAPGAASCRGVPQHTPALPDAT